MRRELRIVIVLVLSLLAQAVAPVASAACAGMPAASDAAPALHADHSAPEPASEPAHDCCGNGMVDTACAGSGCAMGGCLTVTIPVAQLNGVVPTHAPQAVSFALVLPAPLPALRYRPPIA